MDNSPTACEYNIIIVTREGDGKGYITENCEEP